jgi:signal transduction histidine kinase/tetratricopeptide (TPR) repeat protein
MHALTMEKISAAFARGDYRSMADLCELVSANSATAEQAIAAKNMLLRCYGSSFKPAELMATGMELMALAGIRAPKRLCALHVWWARLRLAFALRGRDPLTLADFPEPQDPQYLRQLLATTALLGFGFGFYKDSAVIQWLSLELIRKGIRHGVSPSSAYAFVVWGSTLAGKYDKPQAGYKFAKVGALLGARGSMVTLSTVSLFEGTVRHRREAIRLSLAPLMESYHRATERGDRTGAVVALQFADALRFHGNVPLDQCLQQMRKNIAIARRMDYQAILNMMLPIAITTALLNGTAINDMTGGLELESFALQRTRAGDQWSVFYVRAVQCVGEYYFGDIAAALEHAVEAIGLPGFKYGTPHTASLMFFSSLARLDRARLQGGTPSFVLAEVKAMQRHLQGWASHAPMNYLHKWQLVQAELRLAQNRPQQALDYFDRAILGARNNGYIGDEALANELMGRYLRSAGKYIEARAHMEEAHAKYVEWGAHAKAAQLERIYPGLMKRVTDARHVETARVTSAGDQRLDIDTVIKVSQALSSEIQLDKLLQKLMHILIENAGAQSGILLLQKDGLLRTQATYRTEVRNGDSINLIEVLQDTKAEQQPDLCMAIVNYVKRMRETLVIGDAQKDLRFNSDPHIRESEVKSVLCIPLQKQGELAGIFYLENMLAIDAFTPAHTELLQILSTQIAISLENADLYNELEQKIAARTEVISQRNVALRDTLDSLRQTQRQLVESEKLASLGQLVAGVAHEINTPIGIAVTGASTLAEHTATLHALLENETLRKSDMKKYIESAGTISKLLLSNMERAAALIQSFKAVAVDQTSEERRTFPLRAYLENVLLNLSPLLRRTEHQVVLQCDPDITIDSYPGALSQVVTNLVTNALQHGFDRIDSGVISIDVVELDGQLIELRFADNGNGIAPDSLRKIFDPFFTTRRGQGGSGLGLNIIHNLVTGSLQGKIRVDSAVGRGTTFWLSFPRNPRATAVTGDQAEHKGAYVE